MWSSGEGFAGGALEVREVAIAGMVLDGARIALALEVAAVVVAADIVGGKAACNIKSEVSKIVLSVVGKVQKQLRFTCCNDGRLSDLLLQ